MNKFAIVAVVAFSLLLGTIAYAAAPLTKLKQYQVSGEITTVDLQLLSIYDGNPITAMPVGTIPPNTPVVFFYDLKNVGTTAETVTMTTDLSSTEGTLIWDAEGKILQPNAIIRVMFTITMTLPEGAKFLFTIAFTGVAV